MGWCWPWEVKQAPTYTSDVSDSSGRSPGSCEKCNEYALVCLNGQRFLCWDHYVEAMKPYRYAMRLGQHTKDGEG